jgi:sugar/nucleoside kinase (ribokinase family)
VSSRQDYDVVVATGGLGSGIFLALEGNATLAREESRAAELLDQRDYCKLHIVCHYVAKLLGPGFPVVPIAKVGDDDAGRAVRAELAEVGIDTDHVTGSALPTLFSVCFLYPDGDGGNLTTSRSASSDVSAVDVQRTRPVLERYRDRGVALALPEVPLAARAELLRLGREYGFLRVAGVVTGEVAEARDSGMLADVDLLAVNVDEARALVGDSAPGSSPAHDVGAAVRELTRLNSRLSVVVTAGSDGSWTWDGQRLEHEPAVPVDVVNTAGAGDAHLAAVVVGLVRGLDLATANSYAAVVSGLAVTSRHTINPEIDPASVAEAAERHGRGEGGG